jgi:hypothetical protein
MENKSEQKQSTMVNSTNPNLSWSILSDFEKQKVLLGSLRMPDDDVFRTEFGSWNQPEFNVMEQNPSSVQTA